MAKLPIIKPKQLIYVLEKIGCIEKRQTGSHKIFLLSSKTNYYSNPDSQPRY